MKIPKPAFVFILMILPAVLPLYAAPPAPEDLLENAVAAALRTGERPAEIQFKSENLLLIPKNDNLRRLFETLRTDLRPTVIVETLFLYKKPSGADMTAWTQSELAALYNEAAALSTLQGIQYYSASREAMRTFYETSSVIDSPAAKNPMPDPVFSMPRTELVLYARQKDLTFGDNIYQYTYRYFPGALVLVQENLTNLKVGIFNAVKKNNLNSVLAMLDTGEHILIYAVSMAKAASLPGMNDRIGSSFSNRAEAILQWISSGADRAFAKVHPR